MAAHDRFPEVFRRLRSILEPYAGHMNVTSDDDAIYSLDTRHTMDNGHPLFFGSAQIRKNYVSFHIMPVYVFPELLEDIGDLRKRMQGKSCFNFTSLDDGQAAALVELVRRGYERYADAGMLA